MYIQSDKKTGFQDFTNIKYNLQKFWKEAENNPNYEKDILKIEEKHKSDINEQNKKTSIGCLVIIIILGLFWLIGGN